MDHLKVLKRAGEITWRYRALWVLGIILALTTANGSGSARGGGGFSPYYERGPIEVPPQVASALIAIGVGLACLIVVLIIVAIVARYVAETGLIRTVDDYEQTGEKRGVRQGLRMGWSRTAWRFFLIDVLIRLPVALVFFVLFLLSLAPFLLWATGSEAAGAIGTVAAIGLFFLVLLLVIVVSVVLSLLTHFIRRVCALEELGVIESIHRGYAFVRQHLRDVAVMWLIMVGLSIGWVVLMIPVTLLVLALGAVVGGLPALLVGGLAGLAAEGAIPWLLGAAVGVPIFILVVVAPLGFLGGLWEVFRSTTWTLTYRELRALEGLALEGSEPDVERLAEPDEPGLE
jgi:hypothetical protein